MRELVVRVKQDLEQLSEIYVIQSLIKYPHFPHLYQSFYSFSSCIMPFPSIPSYSSHQYSTRVILTRCVICIVRTKFALANNLLSFSCGRKK